MSTLHRFTFSLIVFCAAVALNGAVLTVDRVKTASGALESNTPPQDGVRSFKGIPFAAPPVGDLRWKEPQPVAKWNGAREANKFGPRCVQRTGPNADYWFRSEGMSEDCLYLNIWTPAKSDRERLPVLVYIFGGGFQNGDGSEPRYDGQQMAREGIVAVTVNYRLNIFGFFAHPELTKESPHHASGNYGLLDQVAALQWVQTNIAAFGGDPKHVTIAGESAGSIAVSGLMASPLSKGLIVGAIGESGAMLASLPARPLAQAEQDGTTFAADASAKSLAALRAMTADQIQDAMVKSPKIRFSTDLDGYFLPKPPSEIYAAGEQSKVPLLEGSNTEEAPARAVLGTSEPTAENFTNAVQKLYGDRAADLLKLYPVSTKDEVLDSATELASSRFIAFGTWKWAELQAQTGTKPVYRYLYARPRPKYLPTAEKGIVTPAPRGASHSAEIQYAMGNLRLDPRYTWTPDDFKVSETMKAYFANFIKTGNPNGQSLPNWPAYNSDSHQIMLLDVDSHLAAEPHLDRMQALDAINSKPADGTDR